MATSARNTATGHKRPRMNFNDKRSTISGLKLISTYSDDESEEENVTNKRFRTNEHCSTVHRPIGKESTEEYKHTNRLPLPLTITTLFKDNCATSEIPQDDPTLHDGRVRSFAHQRGNWSTYIFVSYEPGEGFKELLEGLSLVAQQAGVELKAIQDPHISLTRTVVLLHHWISSFVSSVRVKLSHLPRFTLILGPPAVYCNEERTRTFLGLKVQSGSKYLCEMSHELDGCLAEFRLPPFYKDPQFHMSVLWVVGDAQNALEALLPKLHAEFSLHTSENPNLFCVEVSQCLCKTGNKVFTFPLASL